MAVAAAAAVAVNLSSCSACLSGLNLPPPVVSPAALAGDDSRADTGKLPKRKAAVPPADMAAKGKLPKRQPGAGSKRALASEAAFDDRELRGSWSESFLGCNSASMGTS